MERDSNEPYGFSISYSKSVDNLITTLTGIRRVPKKDERTGDPLPGEWADVEVPNSFPLLTKMGGSRVRAVLEMNMDKFNPIANLSDYQCAQAAGYACITLASEVTLNAPTYIYEYEKDASGKLLEWDAYLGNLMLNLFTFATLAKKGQFITFAGKILSASYDSANAQQQPTGLRRLFSHPRRNELATTDNTM